GASFRRLRGENNRKHLPEVGKVKYNPSVNVNNRPVVKCVRFPDFGDAGWRAVRFAWGMGLKTA
ncbi:MAG: hypothetical protein JTJ29_07940, partial [Bifidobacterium sp.]|nr:hypothetical protein [Bifidobacterium sp.]